MRITSEMSANSMLRSLRGSNNRLDKLQEQLSTGRRLNRPSDDPVGTSRSLKYSRDLCESDQYIRNLKDGIAFLDSTDAALDSTTKIMQRLKELAVYGSNDSLPPESRTALAQETDQLLKQLIQLGNSCLGGQYLFAGEQVLTPPYTEVVVAGSITNVTCNGNNGRLNMELAPRITDYINCTGPEIFGGTALPLAPPPLPPPPNDYLFHHVIQLRDDLKAGNFAGIQAAEGLLDADLDRILPQRSEVGAKTNTFELCLNRTERDNTTITGQIANNDDADIAEATIKLKMEENVYKSALGIGARIIPPSLLDFLR